jgi:hypothetical protein
MTQKITVSKNSNVRCDFAVAEDYSCMGTLLLLLGLMVAIFKDVVQIRKYPYGSG